MAGFDIYIYGTDTQYAYPADLNQWVKVNVLGLDYEHLPAGETRTTQLGGYVSPKKTEKFITINAAPVPLSEWFNFVDTLQSHLKKKFIYFHRGTYPSQIGTSIPNYTRIIPTGVSVEHSYKNGTKSIDIKCVIVNE